MLIHTLTLLAGAALAGPSDSQEHMYRTLSVRDPVPSCAIVASFSETPVEDLLYLVDNATQPPWVGMRAASCLIENHAEEAQTQLIDWVGKEETKGLAILTLRSLDRMPLPIATQVVTRALEGPLAEIARPRILDTQTESLRQLALLPVSDEAQ